MNERPLPPSPPNPAVGNPTTGPTAHYEMPTVNPGQTTGILGLILSFTGLAPIGLILSIISTIRSGESQTSRSLGIIGIVLNALGTLMLIFFAAIAVFAYANQVQSGADAATRSQARALATHANAYYEEAGSYPAKIADFSRYKNSEIDPGIAATDRNPPQSGDVSYMVCGTTGARIAYLQSSSTVPVKLYLGSGSAETCK